MSNHPETKASGLKEVYIALISFLVLFAMLPVILSVQGKINQKANKTKIKIDDTFEGVIFLLLIVAVLYLYWRFVL
jgi:hypothetical protein